MCCTCRGKYGTCGNVAKAFIMGLLAISTFVAFNAFESELPIDDDSLLMNEAALPRPGDSQGISAWESARDWD